jgi:hypothetical protein
VDTTFRYNTQVRGLPLLELMFEDVVIKAILETVEEAKRYATK